MPSVYALDPDTFFEMSEYLYLTGYRLPWVSSAQVCSLSALGITGKWHPLEEFLPISKAPMTAEQSKAKFLGICKMNLGKGK